MNLWWGTQACRISAWFVSFLSGSPGPALSFAFSFTTSEQPLVKSMKHWKLKKFINLRLVAFQSMENRETLSSLVNPACGLLLPHLSPCPLAATYSCTPLVFPPSPPHLIFSFPFYSFSFSFLFLKQPTWGTEPYLLLCRLFALGDICRTSTSPSPLSWDFTIAQSALLAFPFCPSVHPTPLSSLHLLPLEDTLQILPTGLLNLNVHMSPCLTLTLQLQSLTETSISHSIPPLTLTLGLPLPSPSLFIFFWATSQLFSPLKNCQPASQLLLISLPLWFQLTLFLSSQFLTLILMKLPSFTLMSLLTPYSRHPYVSLPWSVHFTCTPHSVRKTHSFDVVCSNCCFAPDLCCPILPL